MEATFLMMSVSDFLEAQNEQISSLYQSVLTCHWMAATTGNKEWSDKHERELSNYYKYFSNKQSFELVQYYLSQNEITSIERRQLEDLFHKMVKNQISLEKIKQGLALEKKIAERFTNFRPTFHYKETTNHEILDVLKHSLNEEERKEAWLASKQIGKVIEPSIHELIKVRNEQAKELGFQNYYEMCFNTQELNIDEVFHLFEQLLQLSEDSFQRVKFEIDEERAILFQLQKENLRPWHYVDPFFQEAPSIENQNMDAPYKEKDIVSIVTNTFTQMGFQIEDIVKRSDLYPRKNKNPFGFCTDADRNGDIRVFANIDESAFWTSVLLHEMGHGVYFQHINKELPFLLRFHAHTLTTEASAMFFGRLNKTREWQRLFLHENEEQMKSSEKMLQRQMLVSARWIILFTFFERQLYENPTQNVNKLWWKLVKEIQGINPPEETDYPDWAAKMHFSLAPVSYQDYLLGELTASQLSHYIQTHISENIYKKEVGAFFIEKFFKPGLSMHWNDLIRSATGEQLTPRYFVDEFMINSRKVDS